jgi:hypothetical protein
VPFVEYLYLSDLIKVICKCGLFDQLGYQSGKKFDDAFGPLVSLRDIVAHPTRSLITDPKSCKKLCRGRPLSPSLKLNHTLQWTGGTVITPT